MFDISYILYFMLVIGILVTIHEFGHFIAAKLSGMRADIFCIGMGPRLFGYNKITGFTFGKLPEDWDGNGGIYTDYRISMLPIGGYVKILGMVDESLDAKNLATEPQPWEFRSKNALLKTFVITAGVIMNILLAIVIFASIAFLQGDVQTRSTSIGFVEKGSLGEKIGFKPGDKILEVDGKPAYSWDNALTQLALKDFSQQRTVSIERMGAKHSLKVSGESVLSTLSAKKDFGMTPAGIKTTIASVITLGPAGSAGLQAGDTITAIAGNLIASAQHLVEVVKEHKDSAFVVEWVRNGKPFSASIKPDKNGLIGVYPSNILGDKLHIHFSFVESVGQGFQKTGNSLMMFVSTVQQIFSGTIAAKQALGGPVKIAEMSKQSADLGIIPFLTLVAMLSITLAVMNILPIPALDGGHLLFIIIEAIIRREVPLKVKVIFQQVGMVILLALMAFVLYNDIF